MLIVLLQLADYITIGHINNEVRLSLSLSLSLTYKTLCLNHPWGYDDNCIVSSFLDYSTQPCCTQVFQVKVLQLIGCSGQPCGRGIVS